MEDDISKNELDLEKMELSLCAVEGISKRRSMKLMGTILGCKVKVLIDSGASHNFVGSKIFQLLDLI